MKEVMIGYWCSSEIWNSNANNFCEQILYVVGLYLVMSVQVSEVNTGKDQEEEAE
jgi:hypothetical protein